MIISKRQIEKIDFEVSDSWIEDGMIEIEIYQRDDIEITFYGKQCQIIELNKFEIKGVKSIQALEKFIDLVYKD